MSMGLLYENNILYRPHFQVCLKVMQINKTYEEGPKYVWANIVWVGKQMEEDGDHDTVGHDLRTGRQFAVVK